MATKKIKFTKISYGEDDGFGGSDEHLIGFTGQSTHRVLSDLIGTYRIERYRDTFLEDEGLNIQEVKFKPSKFFRKLGIPYTQNDFYELLFDRTKLIEKLCHSKATDYSNLMKGQLREKPLKKEGVRKILEKWLENKYSKTDTFRGEAEKADEEKNNSWTLAFTRFLPRIKLMNNRERQDFLFEELDETYLPRKELTDIASICLGKGPGEVTRKDMISLFNWSSYLQRRLNYSLEELERENACERTTR